jgi:hypothetical protein
VTGIVAAIETRHDVKPPGQHVDNLPFAFIAPLGSDHDQIAHEFFPTAAGISTHGSSGHPKLLWQLKQYQSKL